MVSESKQPKGRKQPEGRKRIELVLLGAMLAGLTWMIPAAATQPEIVSMPSSARPGDKVTFAIKVAPETRCSIEAQGALMTDMLALMPRKADRNGKVSWTFAIDKNYKADKFPIIVTCSQVEEKVDHKLVTAIPLTGPGGSAEVKLDLVEKPIRAFPGQDVTISVAAKPGTLCKIDAQDAGITQALALAAKRADQSGTVSWTFNVKHTYKANRLPIVVTGTYKNKERKLVSAIGINRTL